MRPQQEFDAVLRLISAGFNDCEISRRASVPRSTVRDWRRGNRKPVYRRWRCDHDLQCRLEHEYPDLPAPGYSYLLGLYLGDGWISAAPKGVWKLRLAMDAAYPGIIDECCAAIEEVMPGQRAHRLARSESRCVEVSLYSKHWPCLIPQHGPGRKHERRIELAEWQEELVTKESEALVRGLIHSDGCRVVANDRGVRSVRYHFSNRSEDIKRIFCGALDRLGVHWTRPCDRQIAVYRKACTARLDEFIGPKR